MATRFPLLLLLATVFAWSAGHGCFRFFPGSFVVIDGIPAYAVTKKRFVALQPPPGVDLVAHDRFTGLSLFKRAALHPFLLIDPKPPLRYCPSDPALTVTIRSYPVSIFPGTLKERVEAKGALFGACCRLAALVDRGGYWFGRSQIEKLIRGDLHHGDIGARFKASKRGVEVTASDPFAHNGLRRGDIVLRVGSRKNPSLHTLRHMVDVCENSKSLTLQLLRNGRRVAARPHCFERMGGGKVSDTFLERFGITFDKELRIATIDPRKEAYRKGVRRFDRLLAIDGTSVHDERDVQRIFDRANSEKRLPQRMLWERSGFQFFLLPYSI